MTVSSRKRSEQQTSTSEILGIIANSATDLQPVLDAVAENAARLIDAQDAIVHGSMATFFAMQLISARFPELQMLPR